MSEVYKTTLSIDVFTQGENADEVRRLMASMSLDEILHRASEDDMIAGTMRIDGVTHIPNDEVRQEMEAIGSDASFFGDLDGDEEGEDDEGRTGTD